MWIPAGEVTDQRIQGTLNPIQTREHVIQEEMEGQKVGVCACVRVCSGLTSHWQSQRSGLREESTAKDPLD